MSSAVDRGMRVACEGFALEVVGLLHGLGVSCSVSEAREHLDFESMCVVSSRSKASKKRESAKVVAKVVRTGKPAVILPFCGEVVVDWCNGVKFNHGLHTQCTNGSCDEDVYCKTCRKQADNSATGKPVYGDIRDRANFDVDYRDPKGKLTMPYANVVEKRGISMEAAEAAAATLGWTIPASQLVKRVSKRGRPSVAVSDSDSDTEPKKRGRPIKLKVTEITADDQIAQLVAEAVAESVTKKVNVKRVKISKLTAEQKAAKKEASAKIKSDKAALKKAEVAAAKLAKAEAALKMKADKAEAALKMKADKKEQALKVKEEKAAKALKVKEEKAATALKVKEEKEVSKAEKKALALAARKEKAALKKAEREAAKVAKKVPEVVTVELEEEEIEDLGDTSDDESAVELSETKTVGGVEYFMSEQDGQVILFTKDGEPVGIYDADTDTVQEADFE